MADGVCMDATRMWETSIYQQWDTTALTGMEGTSFEASRMGQGGKGTQQNERHAFGVGMLLCEDPGRGLMMWQ